MEGQQVLEIHVESKEAAKHVEEVKGKGFHRVIGDSSVADAAIEKGLDFVLANFWTTESYDWEHDVKDYPNEPNLVSINMMDEPIYWDFDHTTIPDEPIRVPELYCKLHREIHDQHPKVDCSLSFFGPDSGEWQEGREEYFFKYWPAIEQLRMNLFPPYKNRPLGVIFKWLAKLKDDMKVKKQIMPLTITLQAWSDDCHPRYPTVDELRVMSYAALLGGARAVSFYHYDPDLWERLPNNFSHEFDRLVDELLGRTEELKDANVIVYGDTDDNGVYWARVENRRGVEVAVNTTDRKVKDIEPYGIFWKEV